MSLTLSPTVVQISASDFLYSMVESTPFSMPSLLALVVQSFAVTLVGALACVTLISCTSDSSVVSVAGFFTFIPYSVVTPVISMYTPVISFHSSALTLYFILM